jgi:hypothetical protein
MDVEPLLVEELGRRRATPSSAPAGLGTGRSSSGRTTAAALRGRHAPWTVAPPAHGHAI